MSTDFIIKILLEVQRFESSDFAKNSPEIDDFRCWLNDEKYKKESPTKLMMENNKVVDYTDNEICKQILLISRYARLAIRKGLQDFPELANEEFTYLYRIKDEPGLSKMTLIERNGHEKATGMHIIRRLADYDLISEEYSGKDRRSKLIYLTEKGHLYFEKSVPVVDGLSTYMAGNLSDEEKETLLRILIKLNRFHYTQYRKNH